MTCIVGIETKNGVIIGGDSASSGGYDITSTRLKKVFKLEALKVATHFSPYVCKPYHIEEA